MLKNAMLDEQRNEASTFISKKVKIPAGYVLSSVRLLPHDAIPVFVFRYERENEVNSGLGGEYFSVAVDIEVTKIMGIMHIDKMHCGSGLPSEDEAKTQAMEFIGKLAPELTDSIEIKWVAPLREVPESVPHDSPFPFKDEGKKALVTGMRVKMFFTELQAWGWVIVGRNNTIIAFEREIIWNTMMHRRSTPAWLHDEYIKELADDLTVYS